jgi:hypothetical protein
MNAMTKTAVISCTATSSQTLPENAVSVTEAFWLNGTATAGSTVKGAPLAPVSGTAAAGKILFTGKPSAPANKVTLGSAAIAGELLLVTYVPLGGLGAAA